MSKDKCSYDPIPLKGLPIGMFHCPLCGKMIIAGLPHDQGSIEPEKRWW